MCIRWHVRTPTSAKISKIHDTITLGLAGTLDFQRGMIQNLFLVCVLVTSRSLSFSVTLPLHQANISNFLYYNGSLNHSGLELHVRHIQHRHRLAQHVGGQQESISSKRSYGQVLFQEGVLGTVPTIPITVGGQALSMIFDTTALVSTVDPLQYNPQQSVSAQHIGFAYVSQLPDGRMSEVTRWNDIISIGGLSVRATFGRIEDPIIDSLQTSSAGILAFSRHDLRSPHPAPPIYEMQRGNLLDDSLFAFSYPRAARHGSPPEAPGKLTIGEVDRSACHSQLRYTSFERDLRYRNLWATRGTINGNAGVMVLDTSAAFILLPMEIAEPFFAHLGMITEAFGSFLIAKYPCERHPFIQIKIGRRSILLHQSSIQYGAVVDGWCTCSIVGANEGDITLGRPFFENAYTIVELDLVNGAEGRLGLGIV
ncbi:hypothetical protein V8E36_001682 [Tilletia maclaganii]